MQGKGRANVLVHLLQVLAGNGGFVGATAFAGLRRSSMRFGREQMPGIVETGNQVFDQIQFHQIDATADNFFVPNAAIHVGSGDNGQDDAGGFQAQGQFVQFVAARARLKPL